MEMTIEKMGSISLMVLPGNTLDASNAKEFKRSIEPILANNQKLMFDMSGLNFVDSSGLAVLLSCLRLLNASGGDLKLFGMTKPVRALFELVRMHRVFDIFNSKEEAIGAMWN